MSTFLTRLYHSSYLSLAQDTFVPFNSTYFKLNILKAIASGHRNNNINIRTTHHAINVNFMLKIFRSHHHDMITPMTTTGPPNTNKHSTQSNFREGKINNTKSIMVRHSMFLARHHSCTKFIVLYLCKKTNITTLKQVIVQVLLFYSLKKFSKFYESNAPVL